MNHQIGRHERKKLLDQLYKRKKKFKQVRRLAVTLWCTGAVAATYGDYPGVDIRFGTKVTWLDRL